MKIPAERVLVSTEMKCLALGVALAKGTQGDGSLVLLKFSNVETQGDGSLV